MNKHLLHASAAVALLGACAPSATPVPSGQFLSAADIPGRVGGGPYALTIYDGDFAGTTGQSTWDFAAGTVSGSFTTAEGQSGSFENPISIEGNTLCSGAGEAKQCHFVSPYEGGFLEVNSDGTLHAASLPI